MCQVQNQEYASRLHAFAVQLVKYAAYNPAAEYVF